MGEDEEMANLCSYNLYATGTKESLERFAQMMEETGPEPYVWNPAYCSDLVKGPVEPVEGGLLCQHFGAATRWSVEGAMVDRPDSDGVVSLPSAAKMLGLHIHVESEEPDCCFAERITITPDGRYEAECTDLYERSGSRTTSGPASARRRPQASTSTQHTPGSSKADSASAASTRRSHSGRSDHSRGGRSGQASVCLFHLLAICWQFAETCPFPHFFRPFSQNPICWPFAG